MVFYPDYDAFYLKILKIDAPLLLSGKSGGIKSKEYEKSEDKGESELSQGMQNLRI